MNFSGEWDDNLEWKPNRRLPTDEGRLIQAIQDVRRRAWPRSDRIRVEGSMHDLMLSAPPVRARVLAELFRRCGAYCPAQTKADENQGAS
jgi:hypothetical protein